MTRLFVATLAIIGFLSHASAQKPAETTPLKAVRLTGCLASVTGPGGGALPNNALLKSGVSQMSPDEHAKMSSATATSKLKPADYELSAPPSVGLAKHIGHTVEISGAITPSPHGNPDMVPPQGGKHGLREHISVTSLRHIAAKCS